MKNTKVKIEIGPNLRAVIEAIIKKADTPIDVENMLSQLNIDISAIAKAKFICSRPEE